MSEAALRPSSERATRIVEEVEAILACPLREPFPTLGVVVRRGGYSQRSLHTAFLRVHGVSPARYLRHRRLDLVREALLAGAGGPSVIKRAAMERGFRHLSRFAEAYRERFGERPSETLARGRSDRAGPGFHDERDDA